MTTHASQASSATTFTLGYVPGATPGKWARVWRGRLPQIHLDLIQVQAGDVADLLLSGRIDAAIGRLPQDLNVFHAISLYEELPVVVASRDHALAALEVDEEVSSFDIAHDVVNLPWDDVLYQAHLQNQVPSHTSATGLDQAAVPGLMAVAYREDGTVDTSQPAPRPSTTEQAVAWVAQGAGITIVPMSLARLYHRKDVTYRVLRQGPRSQVALIWLKEPAQPDLVEEMVGIVRGRTARSSRGAHSGGKNPSGKETAGKAKEGKASQGKAGSGKATGGKAGNGQAAGGKSGSKKKAQGADANRAARKARLAQQKNAARRPKR